MILDVTGQERDFVLELLEMVYREKLKELHRTDSLNYRELVRRKLAIIEALTAKLNQQEAGIGG